MSAVKTQIGRWYALTVTAGREQSIRKRILDRLDRKGDPYRLELYCPDEEVIIHKGAGETERKRRLTLPGYLLVKGSLNETILADITRVQGVYEFLGGNDRPTQLPLSEVERMLGLDSGADGDERRPVAKSMFNVGDTVTLMEGPMQGFQVVLESVDEERGTAEAMIEIFGRPTKSQVELRHLRKD